MSSFSASLVPSVSSLHGQLGTGLWAGERVGSPGLWAVIHVFISSAAKWSHAANTGRVLSGPWCSRDKASIWKSEQAFILCHRDEEEKEVRDHTLKLFILLINGPCGLTLSLSSSLFSCLKFSLSWNSETCFKPLLCLEQDLLFVRAPKEGHLALGGGWNCCCLSFQGEPLDKRIQLFQLLPIPGWRVT